MWNVNCRVRVTSTALIIIIILSGCKGLQIRSVGETAVRTAVAADIIPPSFNEDTQSGVITLSYVDEKSKVATSCAISNLQNVTVTQACACSAGVCTVRVTGTAHYNGAASFDYTVTTGGVASEPATASLTIDPVDDPPVLTAMSADYTYGIVPITKSFTLSDPDGALACNSTYLSMSSSDTSLIPNANVTWGGTYPNCTVTVWAGNAATSGGVSTITITADDGTLTDTENFTATVRQQVLTTLADSHNARAADFDNDGFMDIAIGSSPNATYTRGLLTVFYGRGDGTFDPAVTIDPGSGPTFVNNRKINIGDLNNDGLVDIVTDTATGNYYFFFNGASRTWNTTPVNIVGDTTGTWVQDYENFAFTDFNKDGRTDMIYGADFTSNVDGWRIRRHDGSTSYAAANWGLPSTEIDLPHLNEWGQDVVAADLNGDTNPDVIATSINKITVFFGNGNDNYSSSIDILSGAGADIPECAVPADVDNDGDQDLFTSYWIASKVSIFRNDGTGTFTKTDFAATQDQGQGCGAADMDKDGYADFVVLSNRGYFFVYYGNSSGGFDASVATYQFPVASADSPPAMGDFDGDGCLDIVKGSGQTSTQTQIFYNRGPDTNPARCKRTFFGL